MNIGSTHLSQLLPGFRFHPPKIPSSNIPLGQINNLFQLMQLVSSRWVLDVSFSRPKMVKSRLVPKPRHLAPSWPASLGLTEAQPEMPRSPNPRRAAFDLPEGRGSRDRRRAVDPRCAGRDPEKNPPELLSIPVSGFGAEDRTSRKAANWWRNPSNAPPLQKPSSLVSDDSTFSTPAKLLGPSSGFPSHFPLNLHKWIDRFNEDHQQLFSSWRGKSSPAFGSIVGASQVDWPRLDP